MAVEPDSLTYAYAHVIDETAVANGVAASTDDALALGGGSTWPWPWWVFRGRSSRGAWRASSR